MQILKPRIVRIMLPSLQNVFFFISISNRARTTFCVDVVKVGRIHRHGLYFLACMLMVCRDSCSYLTENLFCSAGFMHLHATLAAASYDLKPSWDREEGVSMNKQANKTMLRNIFFSRLHSVRQIWAAARGCVALQPYRAHAPTSAKPLRTFAHTVCIAPDARP